MGNQVINEGSLDSRGWQFQYCNKKYCSKCRMFNEKVGNDGEDQRQGGSLEREPSSGRCD